jgi:UDP-N-acetylglucosamine--N-acetylmuramyl-(pentapeptide) pyrophosphoryl-undecaprenol N-acetylglucosamine transferase
MISSRCIAFTGGGTGGHIYPGLAVIESLRKRGFEGRILWIGSKKSTDRDIVEAAGIEYVGIPSGKLRRNLSLENVLDAFRVLAGYIAARCALRNAAPAFLFSKGGYVSVPPCAAASSLGIPFFTHESDLTPGLATRLNARRAELILASYEASREYFPQELRKKIVVTGNPVRSSIRIGNAGEGRRLLGAPRNLPIVLFLGGSQGASQINDLVNSILGRLDGIAFVVHQTGQDFSDSHDAAALPHDAMHSDYRRFAYIREEMPHILAAADMVVGRAGAGTLWECAALGKPMLLIPLCGTGTRGDQVENAELFTSVGAAASLTGPEAEGERLLTEIKSMLGDSARLNRMGEAARCLAGTDAAAAVADLLMKRIGGSP